MRWLQARSVKSTMLKREILKEHVKNELCHKIHEIHQQNIENLRINKIKFPFKSDFLHGD